MEFSVFFVNGCMYVRMYVCMLCVYCIRKCVWWGCVDVNVSVYCYIAS